MNLLLTSIVSLVLSTSHAASINCQEQLTKMQKEEWLAQLRLDDALYIEEIYGEIARDAKSTARISTGLFVAGTSLLTVGLTAAAYGGSAPILQQVTTALIGSSATGAKILVYTPILLTIGGAAGGVAAEVVIADKIKNGEFEVEDLISANKNFTEAEAILDKERGNVNMDYPRWTNVLGMRDRKIIVKLYEISQRKTEVARLRLQHFNLSTKAIERLCQ